MAPGRRAEAADQAGDQIREDVAEQVGGDDDVELPGVQHQLHRAGIDDAVIAFDPAFIFLGDLLAGFQENAGQCLQHVGLVHQSDLFAPEFHGMLKGERTMRRATLARVDAGGHRHGMRVVADRDVVFEGDVEAFEVFAHQDQVDIVEAAARDQRLRGAKVGVKQELFPQPDVDGAEAAADRRCQRAFQRQLVAADAVQAWPAAADRRRLRFRRGRLPGVPIRTGRRVRRAPR